MEKKFVIRVVSDVDVPFTDLAQKFAVLEIEQQAELLNRFARDLRNLCGTFEIYQSACRAIFRNLDESGKQFIENLMEDGK